METRQLNLSGAFTTAWEYFKKHGLGLSLTYLVLSVVSAVFMVITCLMTGLSVIGMLGLMASPMGSHNSELPTILGAAGGFFTALWIVLTVVMVIASIYGVAMSNLGLGLMSGRFKGCTFDAAKLSVWVYVKVFVVNWLTGLLSGLSALCLVIPFFFVAPRLLLASTYQVDHPEAGIFESISASWNMTKGNTLMMLCAMLIGMAASYLGTYLFVIGTCVVSAYFLLFNTAIYYQLKGQEVQTEAPKGDPKLDTTGYSKEER